MFRQNWTSDLNAWARFKRLADICFAKFRVRQFEIPILFNVDLQVKQRRKRGSTRVFPLFYFGRTSKCILRFVSRRLIKIKNLQIVAMQLVSTFCRRFNHVTNTCKFFDDGFFMPVSGTPVRVIGKYIPDVVVGSYSRAKSVLDPLLFACFI